MREIKNPCYITYSDTELMKRYDMLDELYKNLQHKLNIYEEAIKEQEKLYNSLHLKYDELNNKYEDIKRENEILINCKCDNKKNICII